MRILLRLFILAAFALATPAQARPHPAILVSIDGFRADYLGRGVTPVLEQLAAEGFSAPMRPAYPSQTFPNHYTLVTGLSPDHHGIVDNTMEDPVLGRFTMENSTDPRWWNGAEPLWVTADKQGLKTATMFWPGSDREIRGRRPDYWKVYDKAFLADARIDQVLSWLDLPEAQRPSLVTLYLDIVDTVGHESGPNSPEIDRALQATDASIGRLVEGLKARGLQDQANLILVADHGMADTSIGRVIYLDDIVRAEAIHTITAGASATLSIAAGAPADTQSRLLAAHDHLRCWRKTEVSLRLRFARNSRVPPIVCLAEVGWYISTHARIAALKKGLNPGSHGYAPEAPEMAALFIARGPAFRPGVLGPAFDNVDVHPLLAKLLGLKVANGDGSAKVFASALRSH